MTDIHRLSSDHRGQSLWRRWLWPSVLLMVGFYLVPVVQTCGLDCVPGDLGDSRFNNVVLEHFYRWMTGQEGSLLSPSFYYPMPGVSTFSDNHWGTAWIYALLRGLGWDRYQAFDLWYLGGYLTNFVISHWVFRRLRFSPLASASAAFAFAFAMPVIARHGHAQLSYRFLMPVGLLLWQCFRTDGRWRWVGLLALAIAGQFYISIYLGYFMVLLLGAWAVAQLLLERNAGAPWFGQWREQGARGEIAVSLLGIVVAVVSVALLMWPYLHYSKIYGFQRSIEEVSNMLPHVQSYFLADESAIWGRASRQVAVALPMRHEHQLFFGVGMLGLGLVALFRSSQCLRWVAFLSMVLLAVVTLSVHGYSLYLLVLKLPGVGSIRAVARIGLAMALPMAVLVALAVDAVRRPEDGWRPLVFVLVLVMIAESATVRTSSYDIQAARDRIGALRNGIDEGSGQDAILFTPMRDGRSPIETELDGIILAQEMNRPTLNGYSGNIPPGYEPRPGREGSGCAQAAMRLKAAKVFFTGHPGFQLPELPPALRVVGEPECDVGPWGELPLSEAIRLGVAVRSIESTEQGFEVRVSVRNDSTGVFDAWQSGSHPLRLSWQTVTPGEPADPMAWAPRVDLGTQGVLLPGEELGITFAVPREAVKGNQLLISAVLEGRAWLHDYGFMPVVAALPISPAGDNRAAAVRATEVL